MGSGGEEGSGGVDSGGIHSSEMARQVATLEHLDVPEELLDRGFRPGPTPTSADAEKGSRGVGSGGEKGTGGVGSGGIY